MISGKFLVYVEIIYNVNCFQVENILRGFFFRFPGNVFCTLADLRQNSFKPNKFFFRGKRSTGNNFRWPWRCKHFLCPKKFFKWKIFYWKWKFFWRFCLFWCETMSNVNVFVLLKIFLSFVKIYFWKKKTKKVYVKTLAK